MQSAISLRPSCSPCSLCLMAESASASRDWPMAAVPPAHTCFEIYYTGYLHQSGVDKHREGYKPVYMNHRCGRALRPGRALHLRSERSVTLLLPSVASTPRSKPLYVLTKLSSRVQTRRAHSFTELSGSPGAAMFTSMPSHQHLRYNDERIETPSAAALLMHGTHRWFPPE